tara:strand:- start:2158 stop:2823 length:666 start_codon:yes stop_codon:yes gene_type:complete
MPKPRGRPPHDDCLTPAEWGVVNFVRHGLTNQQIADRRNVSLDAIKYHVANAIAKLGLKNRKALKTWVGWPKNSHADKGDIIMNDVAEDAIVGHGYYISVGQISRSVKDITLSEQWYKDVLNLDHLYSFGDLSFFDCGGTRLMLCQAEEELQSESIIYIRVPNINSAYQRLLGRGVEFINAPHMVHKHDDGTEEWMAFFMDPDGRPLSVMSIVGQSEGHST